MVNRTYRSEISVNIPGIVRSANLSEGWSQAADQIGQLSQHFFNKTAEEIGIKGTKAGTRDVSNLTKDQLKDFQLHDDEEKVFNAAYNASAIAAYEYRIQTHIDEQANTFYLNNQFNLENFLEEFKSFQSGLTQNMDEDLVPSANMYAEQYVSKYGKEIAGNQKRQADKQLSADIDKDVKSKVDTILSNIRNEGEISEATSQEIDALTKTLEDGVTANLVTPEKYNLTFSQLDTSIPRALGYHELRGYTDQIAQSFAPYGGAEIPPPASYFEEQENLRTEAKTASSLFFDAIIDGDHPLTKDMSPDQRTELSELLRQDEKQLLAHEATLQAEIKENQDNNIKVIDSEFELKIEQQATVWLGLLEQGNLTEILTQYYSLEKEINAWKEDNPSNADIHIKANDRLKQLEGELQAAYGKRQTAKNAEDTLQAAQADVTRLMDRPPSLTGMAITKGEKQSIATVYTQLALEITGEPNMARLFLDDRGISEILKLVAKNLPLPDQIINQMNMAGMPNQENSFEIVSGIGQFLKAAVIDHAANDANVGETIEPGEIPPNILAQINNESLANLINISSLANLGVLYEANWHQMNEARRAIDKRENAEESARNANFGSSEEMIDFNLQEALQNWTPKGALNFFEEVNIKRLRGDGTWDAEKAILGKIWEGIWGGKFTTLPIVAILGNKPSDEPLPRFVVEEIRNTAKALMEIYGYSKNGQAKAFQQAFEIIQERNNIGFTNVGGTEKIVPYPLEAQPSSLFVTDIPHAGGAINTLISEMAIYELLAPLFTDNVMFDVDTDFDLYEAIRTGEIEAIPISKQGKENQQQYRFVWHKEEGTTPIYERFGENLIWSLPQDESPPQWLTNVLRKSAEDATVFGEKVPIVQEILFLDNVVKHFSDKYKKTMKLDENNPNLFERIENRASEITQILKMKWGANTGDSTVLEEVPDVGEADQSKIPLSFIGGYSVNEELTDEKSSARANEIIIALDDDIEAEFTSAFTPAGPGGGGTREQVEEAPEGTVSDEDAMRDFLTGSGWRLASSPDTEANLVQHRELIDLGIFPEMNDAKLFSFMSSETKINEAANENIDAKSVLAKFVPITKGLKPSDLEDISKIFFTENPLRTKKASVPAKDQNKITKGMTPEGAALFNKILDNPTRYLVMATLEELEILSASSLPESFLEFVDDEIQVRMSQKEPQRAGETREEYWKRMHLKKAGEEKRLKLSQHLEHQRLSAKNYPPTG